MNFIWRAREITRSAGPLALFLNPYSLITHHSSLISESPFYLLFNPNFFHLSNNTSKPFPNRCTSCFIYITKNNKERRRRRRKRRKQHSSAAQQHSTPRHKGERERRGQDSS
jgi:hypothetical protein